MIAVVPRGRRGLRQRSRCRVSFRSARLRLPVRVPRPASGCLLNE
jgi:hypothetical protein